MKRIYKNIKGRIKKKPLPQNYEIPEDNKKDNGGGSKYGSDSTDNINQQPYDIENRDEIIEVRDDSDSFTDQQSRRFDSLEKRLESVKGNSMGECLMAALNKNTESINQQSRRFDSLEKRIESMGNNQTGESSVGKNIKQDFESAIDDLKKTINHRFDDFEKKLFEFLNKRNVSSGNSNSSIDISTTNSNFNDSLRNGICQNCRSQNNEEDSLSGDSKNDDEWCSTCDPRYFIDHFPDWTSGSTQVDSFIRATQCNASNKFNFLEWIPYASLKDTKFLGRGGFGTIYSAVWIDGPRTKWLHKTRKWGRYPNVKVALKSVESNNFIFEELKSYLAASKNVLGRMNTLRIYGMTRNPEEPEKYMMVMLLADEGDLGHYIKENFSKLTYLKKLEILFDMATGILQIHQANLVHRDLHQGNILCQRFIKLDEGRNEYRFVIGDLGLTRKPSQDSKIFYGVIPYCAPEVLESAKYSEASDIYSFGIIMWELAAGVRAFANRDHDELLRTSIVSGLRPQQVPHIPNSYEILMKQCWAPNPNDRPSSQEIYVMIGIWLQKLTFTPHKGISQEFLEADEKRLVKLPVEELSPGARYYSSTHDIVNV